MDIEIEIKENLISRIKNSKDLKFLKALQVIFDSSENELYQLNQKQQSSIEQGRKDVIEGKTKDHSEVMKDTKTWLKNL